MSGKSDIHIQKTEIRPQYLNSFKLNVKHKIIKITKTHKRNVLQHQNSRAQETKQKIDK